MARLILDTGVLIAGARGRLDLGLLGRDDDVALPAIAVAEYLAGVLIDEDSERASAQGAFLDAVLGVLPVHEYDLAVARHHAELLAYVRKQGKKRGAHDLIIAATARATDRMLLTTDARADFAALPGLSVRVVDAEL